MPGDGFVRVGGGDRGRRRAVPRPRADGSGARFSRFLGGDAPYSFGEIVSLVKPHYEADRRDLTRGVLAPEKAAEVLQRVIADIEAMRIKVDGSCDSPLLGDAGNREYFIRIFKPE